MTSTLLGAMLCVPLACAGQLDGSESEYRVQRADGSLPEETDAATTTCDPKPAFERSCGIAACHGQASPAAMLDLVSPGVESRLVEVPSTDAECPSRILIDPQSPSESYLLEKIGASLPECGDRMPLVGTLAPADRACIEQWVHSFGSGSESTADASTTPRKDGSTAAP